MCAACITILERASLSFRIRSKRRAVMQPGHARRCAGSPERDMERQEMLVYRIVFFTAWGSEPPTDYE
jgi:hypothetical protein